MWDDQDADGGDDGQEEGFYVLFPCLFCCDNPLSLCCENHLFLFTDLFVKINR